MLESTKTPAGRVQQSRRKFPSFLKYSSSHTAAPLKWMVSSEPNDVQKEAISKSRFYYGATCPAPPNLLHSVGSSGVSGDLQRSLAHEYGVAAVTPGQNFFQTRAFPSVSSELCWLLFHHCCVLLLEPTAGAGVVINV